jgi:anti-anti-sigma factor
MCDFTLTVTRSHSGTSISCSGELDLVGAAKFRDAADLALSEESVALSIDGRGITLMTSAGIEAILRVLERCRAAGVTFHLEVGKQARRVLDLVGLWWLGVIDDGAEIDAVLEEARVRYAQLRDDGVHGGFDSGGVM